MLPVIKSDLCIHGALSWSCHQRCYSVCLVLVRKHSAEPRFVTHTTLEAVPGWCFGSGGSGVMFICRVNSCVMQKKKKSSVKRTPLVLKSS